jgi:uncharacterized protein
MRVSGRHRLAAASLLALTAGCALSPRQDPTVFLVLAPTIAAGEAVAGTSYATTIIGVGPVAMPRYLERPQLVARVDATELRVDEHARWSAPLGELFAESVADEIAARLAPQRVAVFPWTMADRPALSIRITVLQLEPVLPDSAVLRARWEIIDAAGARVGEPRIAEIRTTAGAGPKAAAHALSELTGRFGAEIAASLRSSTLAR